MRSLGAVLAAKRRYPVEDDLEPVVLIGIVEDEGVFRPMLPSFSQRSARATSSLSLQEFAKSYGSKSSDALPLFGSKGTELCSCVTIHFSSILRKQTVERHHISICCPPSVIVALTWQRP